MRKTKSTFVKLNYWRSGGDDGSSVKQFSFAGILVLFCLEMSKNPAGGGVGR